MPSMTTSLTLNTVSGLLDPVFYCPSPHHDARPEGQAIDMIVVHNISLPPGEFGSIAIEDFFSGQLDTSSHPYFASIAHLKVSAHLLIKRSGDVTQFVPFHLRAWHAGESYFQGKSRCNDFSIGIELEGTDDIPYLPAQYQKLVEVINILLQAYPAINKDRIIGHEDIAPGRKTDPGPSFDWHYLRGLLA
jgi:N-acetyl-anhydromuramoyl-L-alanine amidase